MPPDVPSDDDAPETLGWPSAEDVPDLSTDEGTEDAPDEGADDESGEGEAPEAETAPESEAPETPLPEGDNQAPETFDRKYVESLRNENANWRVKAQTYEQAFAEYSDDERAKFLQLAQGLSNEATHRETAREFVTIGKRILEAYGEDVGDLSPPDPNRPLTAAEFEQKLQQERADRDMQENIRRIAGEVRSLGYEEGSLDHYALLQAANQNPQGDLKQAHEAVQAWKKGIIDSFIKEHSAKATKHLPSTPNVGTGQAPAEQPEELTHDMNDDFQAARRRIDAMLNG